MQQIDPSTFKAYDIRGVYPDQFNEDVAYRVARAYAQETSPKVTVVGRDMRVSGPALTEPVKKGLMDGGSDVIDIGLTSTPMYYYSVNALDADAGMMITASHNPGKYSGFKMTGRGAIPSIALLSNEDLYKVANEADFKTPAREGKFLGTRDTLSGYVEAVLKTSGLTDFGNLKMAIDTANGMGGMILPELFAGKNCEVYPLYFELDGNFPNHEANPLKEETLNDLKKMVHDKGAHLGIAFDGDGDRVAFVDEKGQSIPGDMITALIAREMLKTNPGAIILYDLRSSWAVKEEIEKAGGIAKMCRVGHGLIKKQMREEKALFAGELSSHYYYSNFYVTDNGDLTMLYLLSLLLHEKKPLSELVAPIMRYSHSPEINSKVKDVNEKLAEIKKKYSGGKIIEMDGLTVEYADWWFNVRPSQTEPLLRLNVEARTKAEMEQRIQELLDMIRS